jgi:hypothetical protein
MAKKWSPEEEKFLMENYGKIANKELAKRFGVSAKAVANKMYGLRAASLLAPEESKVEVAESETPPAEEPIVPLSSLTKKKARPAAKTKQSSEPKEPEVVLEYIPTSFMIMTEEGWKPIKMDKRKIEG